MRKTAWNEGPEALGDEDHQDVGEDEQRVEDREEFNVRQPGQFVVEVVATQDDEGAQQNEGDALLGGHEAKQVVGQAHVLFLARLDAVIDSQQGEDGQGAEPVPQDMVDRGQVFAHGDGLREMREFLERVPQEDEGEDLELFSHGFGEGTGQGEDEADDLEDQHQGEGQVHGVKVIRGGVSGQEGREQALTVEFYACQRPEKDDDESQGEAPVHAFVLPEMMERVEDEGQAFEE